MITASKRFKRRVCLGLAICWCSLAWADPSISDQDSLIHTTSTPLVRRSWYPIPVGFYQEETSVGFGLVGGYYFPSHSLREISSITGSVIYTLRNQVKLSVNPRFYTNDGRFHFLGNLSMRYYPEKYYGVGGMHSKESLDYTSMAIAANFQPFYRLRKDLEVGLVLDVRAERVPGGDSLRTEALSVYGDRGLVGWQPYVEWGMGVQITYDTRDNVAYPQHFSHFLKAGWLTYQRAWGASYTVHSFGLDFRQYVPTWVGQVFAWQFKAEMRLGREVPFGMLPTLGGSDLLRGFRERTYTDNMLAALQAEYRIPIWGRFKATVFGGVGYVGNVYDPQWGKLQVGYGAGLRCRLNDARVHLRVDFAGNNNGEFKFYITATEAF